MAMAENSTRDPETPATETQVCITLAADGLSREELERGAFTALDAVETGAAHIALGPVVACDFDEGHIELEFTLEGVHGSAIHQRIGEVLAEIEKVLPLAIERRSQTAAAPAAMCA